MSNLVRRSSRRLSQVLGQFKHRSKPSLTSDVTYGQDSQKSPVEGTNGATNGTTEATPALVTNGITNGTTNGITNGAQHDANLTTSPISVPTSPTIPEEPSTALGPTPNSLYEDATPDSVKSSKSLHLVTQNTPNGQKVQILLEELADAYGSTFDYTVINIGTGVQKHDWFLRFNPNGRIPVLLDNTVSPPFPVHETSAELLYLEKKFDSKNLFGFKDDLERNQALQWLFFWHGSGAPYQGNTNHFLRVAPQPGNEYGLQRFHNETIRVYGVLELHLSGHYTGVERDYLAGHGRGKYSVADIGTWPWVKGWEKSGFTKEELSEFPHLLKYIDRIAERPAVKRGIGEKYNLKK